MPAEMKVATFFTTHAAMRAEKALKEAGVAVQLIPTPRSISSDCTVSLLFPSPQENQVCEILAAARVETSGFHSLV